MTEHRNVLLALTDAVEQAQLEQVLGEGGYEVDAAEDAAALIQQAEQHRPLAILVAHDFGRPRGGLSLCRHLKGNPVTRALAVILVCSRDHMVHPTSGTDGRPDEVLVRPIHPPEVLIRLSTVQRLHRYASEAVQGSRLDPLTGTFNHAYMLDRLRHEVLRASRYGRSIALLLLDVDRFKAFNEREGSTCADLMLREVARALTSRLRGVDLVARTGADEFSVVLPETSLLVARPIAERLRRAVESLRCQVPSEEERQLRVTVSVGIAGLPHPEVGDVPDLLRCARSALAKANEAGGNRSVLY
jgi:two-component system cell cycle response regulator